MAGLVDDRRPILGAPFLDRARVDRLEYVALIVPHGPPQAEPGVVHRHAADVAPFHLAGFLQLFAHLHEISQGLRHFVVGDQIGAVEERADRVHHRHDRELVIVVPERVERLLGEIGDARDVVGRHQILLPQLAPVVVVPDDVALRAVGGQDLGDLRDEDGVGDGRRSEADVEFLGPFVENLDAGLHDRMPAVANVERLRRLRVLRARRNKGEQRRPSGKARESDWSPAFHEFLPDRPSERVFARRGRAAAYSGRRNLGTAIRGAFPPPERTGRMMVATRSPIFRTPTGVTAIRARGLPDSPPLV